MPASVKRNNFDHLARVLPARITAVQEATADDALALMRAEMGRPKHGTQYPDLPNRSSAPGEAPAIQTQALVDDLHPIPTGDGDRAIATNLDYAGDLENGSPDGKVAPRPFMAPAIRAALPKHLKRLQRAVVEAARGR